MSTSWGDRLLLAALRGLPRNALSRAAGRAAAWRLPPPLLRAGILAFARLYGVDLDEIRDPLGSFATFQEFFTRALRDGVRPVDPAGDALVAPCDGSWGAVGIVDQGLLLQLKGRPYRLADLLADEEEARRFEGGAYATFYLAPRDYHRFHAPCDVRVIRSTYVPGTLWPVNRLGIESIDSLFAQNERVCASMAVDARGGEARLCMVAVGATVVGKVRVRFDERTTNEGRRTSETRVYAPPGHRFAKGEEWGRFEIGSTIVLLASAGLVEIDRVPPGTPLRLGARIGRIETRDHARAS